MKPAVTSPPDVAERHREAVTGWRTTEVPPLETAYWLTKPAKLIQGTWEHPKEAAGWMSELLAQHAARFASVDERDMGRLARKASHAAEVLRWGGDISFGYYLTRPLFLSLAVVTCCPNRSRPDQACPAR